MTTPTVSGSPLRIAMVAACPFPANRGTPSRIQRMAEGLARTGHRVDILTYHFGEPLPVQGVRVIRIPRAPYRRLAPGPSGVKLGLLDPLLALRLLACGRRRRYHLIHAHHFEGALVGLAVRPLLRVPLIYDAHTTLAGELHYYDFPRWQRVSDYLDRRVPTWADHVVAVSETLREDLVHRGVAPGRIDVIPTGVNLEAFEGAGPEAVRERWGLAGRRVIIYTGSLETFQGVGFLLRAMPEVFQEVRDAVLVLVGGGQMDAVADQCRRLGIASRVILAGHRPFAEVPGFLSAADVAVAPRPECPGIPQKLVNYMAAGRAVVSFRSSAKLVEHGVSGWVVPDGDIRGLARGILRLLGDPVLRQRLGDGARAAVVGRWEWPVLCRRLEGVYLRILTRRDPPKFAPRPATPAGGDWSRA